MNDDPRLPKMTHMCEEIDVARTLGEYVVQGRSAQLEMLAIMMSPATQKMVVNQLYGMQDTFSMGPDHFLSVPVYVLDDWPDRMICMQRTNLERSKADIMFIRWESSNDR